MKRINRDIIIGSGITQHYNQDIVMINDLREMHRRSRNILLVEGYIFSLVTNGTAEMKVDDHTIKISKGDVFGCMPRKVLEESMFSIDFEATTLFLSPTFVQEVNRILKLDWSFHMMATSNEVIRLQHDEMERLKQYLSLLGNQLVGEETEITRQSVKLLVASMGYFLISLRANQGATIHKKTYTSAENIMHRFIALLSDAEHPLSNVNSYANELNITPKYFSNICKQHLGKTASQIIQEETLRRAQHLLHDSELSIKQISAMLNFKNQSHFGRYFRQHLNMTPQQFRAGKK